jgi:hypothetical protein
VHFKILGHLDVKKSPHFLPFIRIFQGTGKQTVWVILIKEFHNLAVSGLINILIMLFMSRKLHQPIYLILPRLKCCIMVQTFVKLYFPPVNFAMYLCIPKIITISIVGHTCEPSIRIPGKEYKPSFGKPMEKVLVKFRIEPRIVIKDLGRFEVKRGENGLKITIEPIPGPLLILRC